MGGFLKFPSDEPWNVVRRSRVITCSFTFYMSQSTSSAFEAFREHLDDHYDRRERIIKVITFLHLWL